MSADANLRTAIFAHLSARDTLTALIGVGAACRLYPDMIPTGTPLPYVRFVRITNPRTYHMTGRSEIYHPTYQYDVWAADRATAQAVLDALADELESFAGPHSGVTVDRCFISREGDVTQSEQDGGQDPAYSVGIDAEMWYHP